MKIWEGIYFKDFKGGIVVGSRGIIKWDPSWESNLMQRYVSFEGFPLNLALFGFCHIMTPVVIVIFCCVCKNYI